jgi:hypothetical protein
MRKGKALNFERLENRRLLAADLGYDIMSDIDAQPPMESCMIAPEIVEDADQEIFVDPIAPDQVPNEEPVVVDPAISLDLTDGMDGHFGTLDSGNESDSFEFVAPTDGMVDVVVASSFGEHSTNLSITDSSGELVTASATQGLDGFATLSFAADADQSYLLTVNSEDGGQGDFQVTVGLVALETSDVSADDLNPSDTVTVDDATDANEQENDVLDDEEVNDATEDTVDDLVDSNVDETPTGDLEDGVEVDAEDSDNDGTDLIDDVETDPVADDTELHDSLDDSGNEELLDDTVGDVDAESELEDTTDVVLDDTISGPIDDVIEDCTDTPDTSVDLHADEMGPDATVIEIADRLGNIQGELETIDDTDVFKFTSPASGEVTLSVGELSEENVNLDIKIMDADGNAIVDGATNEIVKVSFEAEQDAEYFVSVSSDSDQNGSYDLAVEVSEDAIFDDHADVIGDEATVLDNATGSASVSGQLEVANDTDAFKFTANQDGEIVLDLQVESQDHLSDAEVSVYRDGELIADGTANESIGLRFEAAANVQYQILVNSTNDTPMSYQLTTNEFPSLTETPGELVSVEEAAKSDAEETLVGEEPVVCTFENECADEDVTDEVFSEIGESDLAATELVDADSAIEDLSDFQWAFSFDGDRFYSRFNGV